MPFPKGQKQSPESIAKRRAAFARPEIKAKMRAAKLGRTLSDEHKKKIGDASRGHTLSPESRKKISDAKKAVRQTPERRQLQSEILKELWADPAYRADHIASYQGRRIPIGRKPSAETRAKLRDSHIGHRRSLESRIKQGRSISGTNHHHFKGGPLPSNHRGVGWHVVKRIVRERAGGRCEFCGGLNVRGWALDVHHIVPYREMPVSVDWACLALCRRCHVRADRGIIPTADLQEALRPRLIEMLSQSSHA